MNIFLLDEDLNVSAQSYVDKHVVKIPLELAQMLATSHRILCSDESRLDQVIYKKTHINHPCSKWLRATKGNYLWGYEMFSGLCREYTFRYGRTHLCWTKLQDILANPPELIDSSSEITSFALAMPDECKIPDQPVESYRKYYNTHKTHLFAWKNRSRPEWITTTNTTTVQ